MWTPTQTFWKRIGCVSHGIPPSTLTEKLLTREKASMRNRKTICCTCDQFYVATFSLPVSLAATRAVPNPFPRALAGSADLALWPVKMFTISCSFEWMDHLVVDSACYNYLRPLSVLPVGVLVVFGVIQIQVCHCLCLLCLCCQNWKSSPVFLHGCWLLTDASEEFGLDTTVVCLL